MLIDSHVVVSRREMKVTRNRTQTASSLLFVLLHDVYYVSLFVCVTLRKVVGP